MLFNSSDVEPDFHPVDEAAAGTELHDLGIPACIHSPNKRDQRFILENEVSYGVAFDYL
jgi:hypothetical protein